MIVHLVRKCTYLTFDIAVILYRSVNLKLSVVAVFYGVEQVRLEGSAFGVPFLTLILHLTYMQTGHEHYRKDIIYIIIISKGRL